MMWAKTIVRGAIALLSLLVGACALVPAASTDRDALAKEFLTQPDAATIYVYRSPYNDVDYNSVLYMNGRLIGRTVPGGYFRIETVPGPNVLHGTGIDLGQISVYARAGQVYFVSVAVLGGQSNFRVVPEALAQERVRACCALLDGYAPGTGPFLVH